ncbi:acetate/propionate family kinase [Defluviimonas sp. SAOS-178_SWC]|uniref:acetate/propionate family kinase n=1 Tax=Defluviimonas sp. SAOS-178_SWC TaxID=3121287 RepID=UPI0032221943
MTSIILVLNVGSSSIKFAAYPAGGNETPMLRGKIAGIGTDPRFTLSGAGMDAATFGPISADAGQEDLTVRLLRWLDADTALGPVVGVGHRVVHGGTEFSAPVRIDARVLETLAALEPLAPLHQPFNLAAIRAVAARHPDLPQIACFDTAFHQSQGELARLFALPRRFAARGVLRYGFHGLSYEFIAGELPRHLGDRADGRVVVAHLGNGASMCAMHGRKSVATSMGFTALDGLVMGRRCGTLDAGVVLYMQREMGMSADEIEDVLYRQSGLLGVSGISPDMRVLEDSDDPKAREAIDLFCYRAAMTLAGLVAALGGLDAIVFTAGIGENSARIRRLICERLDWLGVSLDPDANTANATRIGKAGSRCDVLVLPTDEECVIARSTKRLLGAGRLASGH